MQPTTRDIEFYTALQPNSYRLRILYLEWRAWQAMMLQAPNMELYFAYQARMFKLKTLIQSLQTL